MQGSIKCPVTETLQQEDNVLFMGPTAQGQRMKSELNVKFKFVLMRLSCTFFFFFGRGGLILPQNSPDVAECPVCLQCNYYRQNNSKDFQ